MRYGHGVEVGRAERVEIRPGWVARHATPAFWSAAVSLQLDRVQFAHRELVALLAQPSSSGGDPTDEESDAVMALFGRLRIETHFLLVAIRHVLLFHRRAMSSTGNTELDLAGAAFDARVPHAKDFRDVLEHIDEYAAGEGRLQAGDLDARKFGLRVSFDVADSTGEVTLLMGQRSLPVKDAAHAAIELAAVIETVDPSPL